MKRKVKIIVGLLVVLAVIITAGFMTKKWWAGADVISNDPLKTAQTDLTQSSIVKVKIPAGVTKKDVENIAKQKNKDKSKEDLLDNAVEQKFDELEPQIAQIEKAQSIATNQNQNSFQDYIIIYTDENDNPILPDAEKDQSLTSTFQDREQNELTFTWDSSWDEVDPTKVQELKDALNKAYPKIKKLYGQPAFNITVNVKYNSLICGGHYIPSTNEIELNYLEPNVLIHESIHAFRDDYVLFCGSAWEEGMVQLATNQIEYTLNLPGISHVDWPNYEYTNRPDINSSYKYDKVFDPYSDGAAVWSKLLNEDANFFKNFNQKYYIYRKNNSIISYQALSWLIAQIKPEVEKEPFIDWYQKQYIFHQYFSGYQLGSRVFNFYNEYENQSSLYLDLSYTKNTVNIFTNNYVVSDGIKIQIFSPSNKIIFDNIQNINNKGKYPWLELDNILDNSGVKQGRFRIELSAKTESDDWKLKSTNYVFYIKDMKTQAGSSIYAAIYGVIDNKNNGKVTIKSLTKPDMKPATVSVDDGIFYTAEFAGTAGLFQLDYKSPDGKTTATRYFTKDYRSSLDLPYYYVFVSTDKEKPTLEINTKQVANTSATFQIKTNERSIAYLMINESKDNIIKENKDFFKKVVQENTNQEWVETGLKKDTTYYYQFWAIDFAGNITKSEIKTLKTTNAPSAKIISASPNNGARNVITDRSRIKLQFDKDLDPSTVKKENIYFGPTAAMGVGDGPNIPFPDYEISYDKPNKAIIIDVKTSLEFNVNYSVFDLLLKDTLGNYIENLDYSFTTQTAPGSIAPKIVSVKPANKSENNPLNSKIEIEFNVKIKPDDLNSIFWVNARNATEPIDGTTQLIGGKKLVFTPNKPLPKNKLIYVFASFGFKDEAGNWIIPYYKFWKFRTGEN